MNPHARLDKAALERAALHALDSLPATEAAEFEKHLALCSCCRSELDSLRAAVNELGLATPEAALPAGAKGRLFERLGLSLPPDRVASRPRVAAPAQAWKGWQSDPRASGFTYLPAGDGEWEATAHDGIEARRLFVDSANDRVTMMVRMAAGTSYPAHVHGGPEECFVLEGDIRVGPDLHMHAGDYQRVEGGDEHPVQSTDDGCLLLIVSSLHDELIHMSSET